MFKHRKRITALEAEIRRLQAEIEGLHREKTVVVDPPRYSYCRNQLYAHRARLVLISLYIR
jgi:hypothetical protein